MQNPVIFFIILLTMTLFSLFLNSLVWFRYAECEEWIKKAVVFSARSGIPFLGYYKTFLTSPVYKWFARIVALFMFVVFSVPLLLMIGAFLAN